MSMSMKWVSPYWTHKVIGPEGIFSECFHCIFIFISLPFGVKMP